MSLLDKYLVRTKATPPAISANDAKSVVEETEDNNTNSNTSKNSITHCLDKNTAKETIQQRERGEIPPHYTQIVTCKGCGPVYLWAGLPNMVEGCPWCLNRTKGISIPRPPKEMIGAPSWPSEDVTITGRTVHGVLVGVYSRTDDLAESGMYTCKECGNLYAIKRCLITQRLAPCLERYWRCPDFVAKAEN